MLFISHRGNLSGPQPENENKVSYIQAAIDKGFSVEVDVIDFDGHPSLDVSELKLRPVLTSCWPILSWLVYGQW